MRNLAFTIPLALLVFTTMANPGSASSTDTVTIKLGETSKMIFLVDNQEDLENLYKYDINGMLKDLSQQIKEQDDTTEVTIIQDEGGEKYLQKEEESEIEDSSDEMVERTAWDRRRRRRSTMETRYRFGMDIGLNNYLEDGKFPDESGALYTVRPLSWNIAINSNWRTHLGGRFFMDWGPNIMWYNYFFQNENTRIVRTEEEVIFVENDPLMNARYSKLGITYINFQAVPIIYLGRGKRSRYSGWPCDWCRKYKFRGVRVGFGGYSGYRIDSWSKFAYRDENGKKRRIKEKDNYYLSNWRYGLRFVFGFRGLTLYTNYDLNTLFSEGRGPELNAISFGISL